MPTVYKIAWEPLLPTASLKNLQRRDLAVWLRFLAQHAGDFDAVAYDVAVGGSWPEGQDLTDEARNGWRYTTALKIDALLREADGVWVVEVKTGAGTSALGAALAYRLLLEVDEPELTILGQGVVCEHLPRDIDYAAQALGVRTWVV